MPGPYSSEGSLRDAKQLAENLGIELLNLPIIDAFASLPPDARWNAFTGRPEDATEENIQARIRGNFLMALSNKFGSLVLSTGNKSEMAVGYCTLYGDMAGGLAVISDVPKTVVYELSKFVNRKREADPPGNPGQSPLSRAASESKRSGHPSRLRGPGPHPESLRRGRPQPRRNRRPLQSSPRPCPLRSSPRRSKRIQTQTSSARPESHQQSLQRRPPLPSCPKILSVRSIQPHRVNLGTVTLGCAPRFAGSFVILSAAKDLSCLSLGPQRLGDSRLCYSQIFLRLFCVASVSNLLTSQTANSVSRPRFEAVQSHRSYRRTISIRPHKYQELKR